MRGENTYVGRRSMNQLLPIAVAPAPAFWGNLLQ